MYYKGYIITGILFITSIWMGIECMIPGKTIVDPVPGSCTIFSASVGDKVLFGNNEDYYKPHTYLWTEPASEGNYGCIYLGFEDYAHQGGINEKGLCFDANALPKSRVEPHEELAVPPFYEAPYEEYMIWAPVLILRKAASIDEVIEIAHRYQRKNWYPESGQISYQLNFADAQGDAVVISVDENGELAFTRKRASDTYLISTNFNKANPNNALEYPCERYKKAEEMLQTITQEEDLSVALFKSILESVHTEGIFNTTLYSNIFDLQHGLIYLYHWHQYQEVVVLDVKNELAKGKNQIRIKDLFSDDTVNKASNEYIASIFMLCLSILVGIGGIIAIIHSIKKRNRVASL